MTDLFGAIGQSINQDKGFIYGLANNAISYAQSKKAQRRAYEYARKLAEQQYDLTQRGYLESSSNIRSGLEKAGFNPMLAIQNGSATGSGSYSSNAVSANPVEGPDLATNALSFQRLKNETKQADSQIKMNEATAENQSSQALNNLEENKWISPKRKAEIANIEVDTLEKEARIDNMKKQIELGFAGISVQQGANAISSEKNEIERKGNPFRTVRDFLDKYNWSPRQFGEELGRRYFRDHFGPSRRYR